MLKMLLALLVGLGLGYSYGYRQGADGAPPLQKRALAKVGVYKVKEDQERRERAVEEIQRARLDSIESAVHR